MQVLLELPLRLGTPPGVEFAVGRIAQDVVPVSPTVAPIHVQVKRLLPDVALVDRAVYDAGVVQASNEVSLESSLLRIAHRKVE